MRWKYSKTTLFNLAETVRFELTEVLLPRRVSNPVPSATRPRLLKLTLGGEYWDRTSRAIKRRIYSPVHHH